MNAEKVGKAISYLRKRVGYTQKELADRIGVSDKAVSKWERGLGLPDTSIIGKIAILLDTDTDSLLAGELIYHNSGWQGLLILEDNIYGIGAETIIYDKPLVYFLIGYFMLMGIREIQIVCNKNDRTYLKTEFGDGQKWGLNLTFWERLPVEYYNNDILNIMVVTGKTVIYGVDQTRFFQKAMLDRDRITVLSLPKKKMELPSRIYYDSDKKVVSSEDGEQLKTQYDYYQIPIMFCPSEILKIAGRLPLPPVEAISAAVRNEVMYTVILDRGFVEIPVETWNDVMDASLFVKTVQKACGMQIYCIEEIAWRRGLISHEDFRKFGFQYGETFYGKYIRDIAETEEKK